MLRLCGSGIRTFICNIEKKEHRDIGTMLEAKQDDSMRTVHRPISGGHCPIRGVNQVETIQHCCIAN